MWFLGNRVNEKDASTLASFQTVFLTSAAFVITGLPRILVMMVPVGYIPYPIVVAIFWLFNANSILNAVIYSFKFREFRCVAKKLCGCQNEVNVA